MNIFITIVAVVFLAGGILFNQRNRQLVNEKEEIGTAEPKTTVSSTEKSSVVASPPLPTITQSPSSLVEYHYPEAEIIESSENSLILRSSGEPGIIADWYKEKINGRGMKTKTFIETNTNGNVLNKLVGANGREEIRIEIQKNSADSLTTINIFRNN